jgi:RIO kinase 1
MKAPESLETLVEYGIIQEVIRPLMSGKEAQVYVVVASGAECVAKVYKEAHQRTFKHRTDYTEGRRTRNTRDQRAMSKRSQHGRKKDEDAWRNTEVEMIYRLRDAGVRVPGPINFVEGVLVMELVRDAEGEPAPRLGDLAFSPDEAHGIYQQLIREVIKMLCAGVIHGDLSDFNVLMSAAGPVVIDFPQAVDPTHNPNGQKLLLRDVANLHRFLARFAPELPIRPYGQEIWSLFQANKLAPDTVLTGLHRGPEGKADTSDVMALIEDAHRDEQFRRHGRDRENDEEDEDAPRSIIKAAPFRKVVDFALDRSASPATARVTTRPVRGASAAPSAKAEGSSRPARPTAEQRVPPRGPAADNEAKGEEPSVNRRRRSRRGGRGRPGASSTKAAGKTLAPKASGAGPTKPSPASGPTRSNSDRAPRDGAREGADTRPRRRRRSRRKPAKPQ